MRYGLGIITVFITAVINFFLWYVFRDSLLKIMPFLASFGRVSIGIIPVPFGGMATTGFLLALLFTLILPFRDDNNPFFPAWFASTVLPFIIIVVVNSLKAGLF